MLKIKISYILNPKHFDRQQNKPHRGKKQQQQQTDSETYIQKGSEPERNNRRKN